MSDAATTVGIVLAGGQSSRMGQDKATLLTPQGRTWAEHGMAVLRTHCASVVLNNANGLADQRSGFAGPLAGIEAALLAYPEQSLLILPVDMPLVTAADLLPLVRHAAPNAAYEDSIFPLKVLASANTLAVLQHCLASPEQRQHSVRAWLRGLSPPVVWLHADSPERLVNINHPHEWQVIVNSKRELL